MQNTLMHTEQRVIAAVTKTADRYLLSACRRCGGTGRHGPHSVEAGVCFGCRGEGHRVYGTKEEWEALQEAKAKKAEAADKRRARKRAKLAKAAEAFIVRHNLAECFTFVEDNVKTASLRNQLFAKGALSEAQVAFAHKLLAWDKEAKAKKVAEAAAKEAAPRLADERQQLTGIVRGKRDVESVYGWQKKILVDLGDGNKVWGSCPRSLVVEVGARVSFSAVLAYKEPGFYIFSRPTKAKVL